MITKNIKIMKDYFNLVETRNKHFLLFIIFNLCSIFTELFIPLVTAKIVEYVTSNLYQQSLVMVLILAILYGLNNLLLYGDYYHYACFFKQCYVNLHTKVINCIYHFDENYMSKLPTGKIVNTCNMDLINISELPSFFISIIVETIKLGLIFIIFMKQNMMIGIYVMILNFLYGHYATICNNKNAFYMKKQRKYADDLTGLLSQVLRGLRDIKSFNFGLRLNNKFDTYRKKWEQSYFMKRKSFFMKQTVVLSIMHFGKILLYLFLLMMLLHHKISLAMFLLLIAYYDNTRITIQTLMDSNMQILEESVSLYRIADILNYQFLSRNELRMNENDHISGIIEFKNVSFSVKNQSILKNISFQVPANTITAIVGENGAGKTTIFNLLLRFIKPDHGKILIDHINIDDYSNQVYSSNVAIVNQTTFLFNMSIRENLQLIDKNKEHQINACKRVGIHNFIMSLPRGYQTILKEDATNISGGQKQLLSLARALLTTAEILLLDEVTSSLDPKTTKHIASLLSDLKTDHTVVLITHEKELMQKADQLIVLKQGKIIGHGDHETLLTKNKGYQELLQKQR